MKKILCVIADELSEKNEEFLNKIDDGNTRIELFTGGISVEGGDYNWPGFGLAGFCAGSTI